MRAFRFHQAVTVLAVGAATSVYGVALPPAAAASIPSRPLAASAAGFVVASVGGGLAGGLGGQVSAGLSGLGPSLGGPFGGGIGTGTSPISSVPDLLGLSIGGWVLGSAKFALDETAAVLGQTTTPQLRSSWFSATYWRMAAIAAVLTLPFLFAAAVQALVRSDLTLLLRAAFGYLPLAMLAVAIAAPLTMLLLAASDELSRAVSAASGGTDASFLSKAGGLIGSLSLLGRSPFLAFLVGGFTVAGAVVLWIELLIREAAVYVVVLMLPLAFAALVWPARRVWATRTVELLVALVLSKFAIVAVLSLGGAAMSAGLGTANVAASLAGLVLLVMAAFTPWALMRFVPVAELAAGTVGSLRHEVHRGLGSPVDRVVDKAWRAHDSTTAAMAGMRREAALADTPAASADTAAPVDAGAPPDTATPVVAGTETARPPASEPLPAVSEPAATSTAAAGAGGVSGPGTPTSPASSPASAGAVSPGGVASPEQPAHAATDFRTGPGEEGEIADDPDAAVDRLPGFDSHVQLEHPLVLDLDQNGLPAWRAASAASRPGRQADVGGPRSDDVAEPEVGPTAQPPVDGSL